MNAIRPFKKLGGKLLILISFVLAFQGIIGASSANASCVTVDEIAAISSGSGTYETCGGDDLSYRIPISGSVIFGGVTYANVYATTNSVVSFGAPDPTFITFPDTPSISLGARDWVVDGFVNTDGTSYSSSVSPNERADEFFKISINENRFTIDISARQFGGGVFTYDNPVGYNYSAGAVNTLGVAPTRLILSFLRDQNGTLFVTSFNSNDVVSSYSRSGCVLTPGGTAITLDACGIIKVETVQAIIAPEEKINYLIATTPLKVSQSKEVITCTSATLKYMIQGVQAQAPKLTTQSYIVKVDGKIVAQKSTLDSSANFDKKFLPTSGIATCSQVATQEDSQVTVESEISTTTGDAAKARKAEVAKIHADFKAESQKLMDTKLAHLAPGSTGSYRDASEQWQAALLNAQFARDAAIKAAYAKEAKASFDAGMKVEIKP